MLVGLLCAIATAIAYGVGSVLESVAIRRAGAAGGEASELVALRSQPLYFLGLGLDGVGFLLTVAALQFLPLFLVQAVVAASVGVTALIAGWMGVRLGRSGWVALAAAGVGLVLLSLSAAAENGASLSIVWRWVLLLVAVPLGVLIIIGPRLPARLGPLVLALGAGLEFSVVAVASRALDFPNPLWRMVQDPAAWAILVAGGLAIVMFAMALQIGNLTTVSAITFTTETVLPAAIGLAFLGDSVRAGWNVAAVVGFVLAVGGAIALARFAEGVPDTDGRAQGSTPRVVPAKGIT
jgi:drug/metabolite transporter (DMT)-like permease